MGRTGKIVRKEVWVNEQIDGGTAPHTFASHGRFAPVVHRVLKTHGTARVRP